MTGCKLDTKNAPPSVLRHDSRVYAVIRVARFSRCEVLTLFFRSSQVQSQINLRSIVDATARLFESPEL